jgi:hypothetical protein
MRNDPDIDMDDSEAILNFGLEMDQYIDTLDSGVFDSNNISSETAGKIQAAIFAQSSLSARDYSNKNTFQSNRPTGYKQRYKDGFLPDFRVLQESLHAYINLGRVVNRLKKKSHTATVRLKELHRIYPRWGKVYDKYNKES